MQVGKLRGHNQFGVTFIEMLLVLIITAFLVGFPMSLFKQTREEITIQQFLQQVEGEIRYMQNYAILKDENTSVKLSNLGIVKGYFSRTGVVHNTIQVPETLTVSKNQDAVFKGGSGNISKIVTFSFVRKDNGTNYKLIFQLGSGRYVWQEEKKK